MQVPKHVNFDSLESSEAFSADTFRDPNSNAQN